MDARLALRLADSEVAGVAEVDPDLVVRFAAAGVSMRHGDDRPVDGFSRGVSLRIRIAQVVAEQSPLLGRLARGRLQVAGRWLDEIPLPFETGAPVHLELGFANRAYLIVTGAGLRLAFDGAPNASESLAC